MSELTTLTPEEDKIAKRFREIFYEGKGYNQDSWRSLSDTRRAEWYSFYSNPEDSNYPSDSPRFLKAKQQLDEELAKENTLAQTSNTSSKYSFVSREEDIDFNRILREAPRGTNFILVEARTRDNSRVKEWALLIHNSVLSNPLAQGFCTHEDEVNTNDEDHISPEWGEDEVAGVKLYSYRVIGGDGKAPGKIKKQIEDIKKAINVKDTRTVVTLL